MGLIGAYLWYRSGKKRATKRAQRDLAELEDEIESAEEVCDDCGYTRAQHSDEGDCPRYD